VEEKTFSLQRRDGHPLKTGRMLINIIFRRGREEREKLISSRCKRKGGRGRAACYQKIPDPEGAPPRREKKKRLWFRRLERREREKRQN